MGFAVVWVLVLIAIVALLGASALHDAWFAQSQAALRLHEQCAWAAAELGLRAGAADLTITRHPDEATHDLRPTALATDHVTTRIRKLNEREVAIGFSAGRFVAQEFEIESTGHSARGTQRTVVQGIRRVMPAVEAP
jgi:Tfp pilus assembly protein PilX